MKKLLRNITVDPVNLSFKNKLLATISCFGSILLITQINKLFFALPGYPLLVASMGATSIILFFIPSSPLAQPWPVFVGQVLSAVVGMTSALYINEIAFAAATAVGGAVIAMLVFRCLHPPAAATALTPLLAGPPIISLGYGFVLIPVALNTFCLVIFAIIINRWVMKRNYPSPLPESEQKITPESKQLVGEVGISTKDAELALKEIDTFVDITPVALSKLLSHIELNKFKQFQSHRSCQEIMVKEVVTVEFSTEIEDAWAMLYQQNLKAMPVVDNATRVIGIITRNDFFKQIDLKLYDNLQDKFRNFIRRTAKLTTHKPESVGQIMTATAVVIQDSAHIADLIPLMSLQGHKQIPVVNDDNRLVGMVDQNNLIAALYFDTLAQKN